MRIRILAVGRMKSGPESDLLDRYLDRARKAGRPLGISRIDVAELSESRLPRAEDRQAEESAGLIGLIPDGASLIALDERGRSEPSPSFADLVARDRDRGVPDLVFAIGGPDGHGDGLRTRAGALLALGAMTWPHQLVRVLLAEQLYRAMTILSGHPYHRS